MSEEGLPEMGFVGGSQGPVQILIVDADPAQRRIAAGHARSLSGTALPPLALASRDEAAGAMAAGARIVALVDLETVGRHRRRSRRWFPPRCG